MPDKKDKANRLMALSTMLRNRGYTVEELAEHFGRSVRSLYRDLDDLRAEHIPVELHGGMYRIDPSHSMPTLNLTENELIALYLACRTLELRGTLPDETRSALEKMRASALAASRHGLGVVEQVIEVAPVAAATSPEHFKTVLEGYQKRRVVEILYHSRDREEPVWRRIEPWGYFFFAETWYVVGHDHLSGQQRTFRHDRVRESRLTEQSYDQPKGFDLGSAMFHRFDVGEGPEIKVRLQVSPELVRYLTETPGHHSQRFEGDVVEYRVKAPLRMTQWLLGLGVLEVLEPADLRAEVARMAAEIAARNSSQRVKIRSPRKS